jgi:hypothetical protein
MINKSYETRIHDLEIKVLMLEKQIHMINLQHEHEKYIWDCKEATQENINKCIARGFNPSRLQMEGLK